METNEPIARIIYRNNDRLLRFSTAVLRGVIDDRHPRMWGIRNVIYLFQSQAFPSGNGVLPWKPHGDMHSLSHMSQGKEGFPPENGTRKH